jgi:hypothetical protein
MAGQDLQAKLRSEILVADAKSLLPHHRRDALLVAELEVDLLAVAVAIASDAAEQVAELLSQKKLYKPTLAQLADWCIDVDCRFQYVILQPYVLAQVLPAAKLELS